MIELQIGRLNLLTPTRVAAAAKEIRTGEIVPVKYVLSGHVIYYN